MSKIKKFAVLATVFSAGALVCTLAERAKVAGQTPARKAQFGLSFEDYDTRPLSPDGRRIGSLPARDGITPYPKKYYVADLALPQPPDREGPTSGRAEPEKLMVDFTPLVDLIAMTVAPGTWVVQDGQGHELAPKETRHKSMSANPRNTIAPLFPFASLVITCSDDVHKDVAEMLRSLRRLRDPLDPQNTRGKRLAMLVPRSAFNVAETGRPDLYAIAARRTKIDQLLKDLREVAQELESIPVGRETVPVQR
jgi:hypothetical protein